MIYNIENRLIQVFFQIVVRDESVSVLRSVESMATMFKKLSTASILNEEIAVLKQHVAQLTRFIIIINAYYFF